jgi:hypothetical protein
MMLHMANRPPPAHRLDDDQRAALSTRARSRALPQRQVLRPRVVLLAAEGVANSDSDAPAVLRANRPALASMLRGVRNRRPREGRT